MRSKIYIISISIAAIALGISIYSLLQPSHKVSFVRSSDVLQKYLGFREAQGYIDGRTKEAQIIADSLYNHYVSLLEEFNRNENTFSEKEKIKQKAEIEKSKKSLEQYQQKAEEGLSQENEKILQGALNQVNAYIKEYAEKNGIDLVIGVTSAGNVLYGKDNIDITEQIIDGLNKQYKK